MRIPQDRLCLCCEKAPIIGKPYSVYVCRDCYLHGPLDDYDTVGRSLGRTRNGAMTDWEPHPSVPNTFQRFACDPPPYGAAFQVLRQEWDEDGTHRTILEVRLIAAQIDGNIHDE